jgi:hypothetical protein
MTDSQQRLRLRGGVTLLEVLIAIGVMAVGLMGMAALIPLGRMELAEAEKLDNASAVGRAAFRDLTVRGYLRPEMWVSPMNARTVVGPTSNTDVYSPATSVAQTGRHYKDTTQPDLIGPPYAPLVIDPLMIAPKFFGETVGLATLVSGETQHRQHVRVFPYTIGMPGVGAAWPEATAPKIARVTLRSIPPAMAGAQPNQAPSFATTMRFDSASRFFRADNDLTMQPPEDKMANPVQEFAVTQTNFSNLTLTPSDGISFERRVNNVAYRKFRGDYSWFLVVEPSLAEAYSADPRNMPVLGGPTASLLTTHQYRVWTVVCYKRDLRDTGAMDLSTSRDTGERMAWIDFIDRNTARIRMMNLDRGEAMKQLELQTNQWFAAIGCYPEPRLPNNAMRYVMEWYRIINVADDVATTDGGSTWYREVTIAGREFSNLGFEFIDANNFGYPDVSAVSRAAGINSGEPLTAWGVLVSGARGVFEKSVFVDRPSSWALE